MIARARGDKGILASFLGTLALALAACAAPSLPTATPPSVAAPSPKPALTLDALREGDEASGFTARALFVDGDDHPRGARFVHTRTGFVFDYLAIESAPQAMIYTMTYPSGDGGEPHTQEHLLLGKGKKGTWLGNIEHSTFSRASAFTAQHRTAYHFNTAAGAETFWNLFGTHLDALLHPDYSDVEIRREVRHFGVSKQPDGSLALGEKGNVYNEMVRAFESPHTLASYATRRLVYGDGHPLAYESGGTPEGIRALTPEAIHSFHREHYRLGNMGVVGAFPSSIPMATALARMGAVLDALPASDAGKGRLLTDETLPAPHGAPAGTIRVVDYPYASADHPSRATLTWPATRKLGAEERTVLELFLQAFAEHGSPLYKALVDRTTRTLDLGATDVWSWVMNDLGEPVDLGVNDIGAAHADEASMRALRDVVQKELARVAAFPDGSPELAAFDDRVKSRVVAFRRRLDKMLDTPPEFGVRETDADWIENLDDIVREKGFRKSLTYREATTRAGELAASAKNEWRDRIARWGLLETPYVVVGRPSPAMRESLDAGRDARVATELARLEASYGTHDAQEALRKREAEIAAEDDAIAKDRATVPFAPLAPDPPMTNDDSLKWTTETRGGVTHVASTFETMKSAAVGLGLRLETVPDDHLAWLGVLPQLVSDVGVIRDGVPIPYDVVDERIRKEVLGVRFDFAANTSSNRAELIATASGNDADETKRALGWVRDFLRTPDWRPENLPRIRDVLDHAFTNLHGTMSGPEERWVEATAEYYRRQDHHALAHAGSFLTRVHDAFVTSWMLEGGDEAKGVAPFLKSLGTAEKKLDRTSLAALAKALASTDTRPDAKAGVKSADPKIASWVTAGRALPKAAQSRVRKAGRDLGALLGDLPDGSLASDWAELCGEMAKGVSRPPSEGLDALRATLASIRHVANARLWTVGSTKTRQAILPDVDQTLATLDPQPAPHAEHATARFVLDRAHARGAAGDSPFVALVNASTGSSSMDHSAPSIDFDETRPEALVDYLAANVFNGEGTQSFYKRIWGAALAYGGYLSVSLTRGRSRLYSDRCVDLPQLLRFTEGEVKSAPKDDHFVDYAIVPAFWSFGADSFEVRGRVMAADLTDGITPERVRAFRERMLALRQRPGLAEAMHARYVPAMSAVIPSLRGSAELPAGALYFTVGPEAKIADYEREIQRTRGETAKVMRVWPRDFRDVRTER